MACTSCGFERIEEGRSCPVCGAETLTGTARRDPDATVAHDGTRHGPVGMLRHGDVFAERYQIEATLGRGGMGSVYRALDRATGEPRALKILHAAAADASAAVRFKREISILSRIDHPAVLRISDWGISGQRMYFAAELLDGSDLRQHLHSRIVLSPPEVGRIGGRLAEALEVAHQHGIVHRDIKPHNVMVCRDGSLKLLDFGIARGAGIDMNTVTTSGVMVGTPEYMSPEQFMGQRVDARSDIYSLGVVLYELTAGVLPFTADTPIALGIQHQSAPPPPIRPQRAGVPAWLERIILRCLQKDPADRFQTAGDLAVELLRTRKGEKRVTTLPSGDQVVEDDSESEPWALTISSAQERRNWTRGMALRFDDRYYRLEDVVYLRAGGERWLYRFSYWPSEEIFRKLVDYEQDVAERRTDGVGARFKRWFS